MQYCVIHQTAVEGCPTIFLRAVELARSIGIRPAARQIGVDERRIREWITKEATLKKEEHPSKRRRLEGGGRKPDHSQFEEDIVHWIVHERELYHRVTQGRCSTC